MGQLVLGFRVRSGGDGISNVVSGQKFFQYNVLGSAILSAAQGAATMGLSKVMPVSQASAGPTMMSRSRVAPATRPRSIAKSTAMYLNRTTRCRYGME